MPQRHLIFNLLTIALNICKKKRERFTKREHQLLNENHDGQTLVNFNILYQKILRYIISYHNSLKRYEKK